jgi:hypothetical protein
MVPNNPMISTQEIHLSGKRVNRDLTTKMWTCAVLNEVAKSALGEEKKRLAEVISIQVKSDLDLLPHRPRFPIRGLGRLKLPPLDCFDSLLR